MGIIRCCAFVSDVPCRMLDKTQQTGSPLQFVNGLILMSTFFGARLVYGPIMVRTLPRSIHGSRLSSRTGARQSWQFFQTLFEARDGLSVAIFAGYACGNTALTGLNV